MRRRAKKRTQNPAEKENTGARNPKSMVIRIGAGSVGPSVSQLVTDVRKVMEPGTASRLRERKNNRLRDYVTMCGPLGVTHLMLFSRSESGNTNMRLCLAPKGPTLHFRVEKYSLAKDIHHAQRHPRGTGKEFNTPPLLVMNNFVSTPESNNKTPRHLETLTTTVFQSLFPPINPQATPLKSIKRVLLLNREATEDGEGFIINFRHYAIITKATGVSKAVKRIDTAEKMVKSKQRKASLPNLGRLTDISDYMQGGENGDGYVSDVTSGSEVESDAEVEITEEVSVRKPASKQQRKLEKEILGHSLEAEGDERVEKRAIKLIEIGPRMRLRLTKVEEDICSGRVMWHESLTKSHEEIQSLEERWETRRREKAKRKSEQKGNVARKKEASTAKQEARQQRRGEQQGTRTSADSDDSMAEDSEGSEDENAPVRYGSESDDEYLGEEVDEDEHMH